MTAIQTWHERGRFAYAMRSKASANPYRYGTEAWRSWADGWQEGWHYDMIGGRS